MLLFLPSSFYLLNIWGKDPLREYAYNKITLLAHYFEYTIIIFVLNKGKMRRSERIIGTFKPMHKILAFESSAGNSFFFKAEKNQDKNDVRI